MKPKADRWLRWMYGITMAAMVFTGLGQMPVFKRYYISSIPGMAWSADFYVTLFIHYLGAVILAGLLSYAVVDHALLRRKSTRVTRAGYVRAAMLAGLMVTGVFCLLRNLPEWDFSPAFTMAVDISHLLFMMLYGAAALLFWRMRARWVAEKAR